MSRDVYKVVLDQETFEVGHSGTPRLSEPGENAAENEMRPIAIRIGEESRV